MLDDVFHANVRVQIEWRQRMWRCLHRRCERGTSAEQAPPLVAEFASITTRAVAWAIEQLDYERAKICWLARQCAVGWWTLRRAIKPVLEGSATDESRFACFRPWATTSTCDSMFVLAGGA